ncbi:T9SS type A sorting domain-containing protein [Chitinophaga agrisoli]|uniref:T9SS type A sorting domain-containing protein n=1 Tax=Chitinophaga agrisoli TaxID=2607653 RepID=A0A5B2VU36_9BACT|nr:T9SS type A sorting domain-containing protein [Chitinophaga agrisoli]KAA2242741.1 T9SS type A sorting domain-containing protein [Chitinophaga agrisoli]
MKYCFRTALLTCCICLLSLITTKVWGQAFYSSIYIQMPGNPPHDLGLGVKLENSQPINLLARTVPLPVPNAVYGTAEYYHPQYRVFRNGVQIGTVDASKIYPISDNGIPVAFNFFGPQIDFGYFKARFVYEMPDPTQIVINFNPGATVCGNAVVNLLAPDRPLFSDNVVRTSVVWEYNINGRWKGFDSSSNALSINFEVGDKIPELRTATQTLRFRYRKKAEYIGGVYGLFYSEYSPETGSFTFYPPPPKTTPANILITPACYGQNNGWVSVAGNTISSPFENMRWILRPGNVAGACDPGLGNGQSNCGDIIDWSEGAVPVSGGLTTQKVGPGTYSLWLVSPGGSVDRNCMRSYQVVVPQLNQLLVVNNSALTTNISCYGGSDGVVSVTASGGDGANSGYFFTLETATGTVVAGEQRAGGNVMSWSNLPAGSYRVWVRDNTCNGVRASANITLGQPPLITGQIMPIPLTCNTPGNGGIAVTADAGAASYEYNLYQQGNSQPIQTSGAVTARNYTFSGLSAGSYTVEIRNADHPGCDGWTAPVALDVAPPLGLQLAARDSVSCYGGNDGHLQFTGAGGSGTYQYTLSGNGIPPLTNTSGDFTGLTAGSYTITLTNAIAVCNDQAVQTYTVYQRSPLQVQLQATPITCAGKGDGILKAIAAGGSGSYKYTWQQFKGGAWVGNSFWFNTDTQIEALAPGRYRVIIEDSKAAGCTVMSDEIELSEPAPLTFTNITVQEAVCLADGAGINISASGGDGNYTYAYSLDGGNAFTNFTATDRLHTAGNYTLRVTDGAGCATIDGNTYSVTLPAAALSFSSQLSDHHGFNLSCTHAGDGSITVNGAGGNGGSYSGYQYSLNGDPYQSANRFSNLAAGAYTIRVKDGRGCEVTDHVTLTEPSIVINATKQDITCYGQSTGSITTSISGGAAPYAILMNGVAASAAMTNLAQGDYTLHITDANGCSKDTLISIVYTYPALSIQNLALTDISCYGSTANIDFTATGGDGIYQYWLSTDNWASQTPYVIGAPLTAGDYALQFTDGHGCAVTNTGILSVTAPPAQLSFTAKLSDYNGYNISCAGGSNGFAQITATGGNGGTYSGYTYALDNGPFGSAALIQNINAGTHVLRVKDARGCEAVATYSFTESAQAIDLQLVSKQDVTCAGIPAGGIRVAGSGGAGGLQYSIDNTNWQSSGMFTGLVAGSYTVAVRDVNSCGVSITVQVNTQNAPIVVDNITRSEIVCFGTKGSINVQAHGGTGALTYEYSLDGGVFTAFNNNTGFHAGHYTVRIKDAAGCYSAVSDVLAITAPAAPLTAGVTISDFNGIAISCYGLADGVINVAASGGNGDGYAGYQYSINNSAYTTNGHYSNLSTGNYQIKIQDGRGCIITRNVVLQQPAAPVSLAVTGIENLVCGAQPTGKITLQAGGGIPPYGYSLNNGAAQDDNSFAALSAGNYTLQVKDVNGCAANTTTNVTTQYPAITATANVIPVNCFGQADGAIKVSPAGGDGNYTYNWNTADLSGPDAINIPAGNYALTIADGTGCSASFNYAIVQPDLLVVTTAAGPVCDGLSDGLLDAQVQGGLTPYQYSLDEAAWQSSGSFDQLSAGTYHIKVQDANGCITANETIIPKANTRPDIDFLVASRKNALDTLAITEISLPAPDETKWAFSPEAVLLGYDKGMPLIKFNSPGTYWVEMTARFEACTYSLRKDIEINEYDPLSGPGYDVPVHVIDTVTLAPNPNEGQFRFRITLNRKQQVVVYVYTINGGIAGKKQYSNTLTIEDQFSLDNPIPGTYILRVIAESESRDIRFIITR